MRFYPDDDGLPRGPGPGRGFDIDSRVQVFEATIRVLGGLLSAHQYATGQLGWTHKGVLPVPETLSLSPSEREKGAFAWFGRSGPGVRTQGKYSYDGHLLDLAHDLASRMLPAFESSWSGVPYPRVNLRHGVQFAEKPAFAYQYRYEGSDYRLSPFYAPPGKAPVVRSEEEVDTITNTCPAGAGSLVLEFVVLSRLTGDGRFEEVAKRAFNAVWKLRSSLGLLGAGLDVGKPGEAASWAEGFAGVRIPHIHNSIYVPPYHVD